MKFCVLIFPNGLGNKEGSYSLGLIEAPDRNAVIRTLETPLEGSNEPLVPSEQEYRILPE